mmetsp:Transcript_10778/g.15721  ORF Transcript_10778/g.15721 Transcript_10778/m.15721 type:complete len:260 (+) Transcript_10778:41-820(+)
MVITKSNSDDSSQDSLVMEESYISIPPVPPVTDTFSFASSEPVPPVTEGTRAVYTFASSEWSGRETEPFIPIPTATPTSPLTPVPTAGISSSTAPACTMEPCTMQAPNHDGDNALQLGAGVIATIIVLPLLGPILATVAGVTAAYGTTRPGAAGDACRAAGEVALTAKEKAMELNQKHHIVHETTEGTKGVLQRMRDANGRYEIWMKVRDVLEATLRNVGDACKFTATKVSRKPRTEDCEDDVSVKEAEVSVGLEKAVV